MMDSKPTALIQPPEGYSDTWTDLEFVQVPLAQLPSIEGIERELEGILLLEEASPPTPLLKERGVVGSINNLEETINKTKETLSFRRGSPERRGEAKP